MNQVIFVGDSLYGLLAVDTYECRDISTHTHHAHTHIYMCVYIYTYMCVCIYIHNIYIYMCVCIYMYIVEVILKTPLLKTTRRVAPLKNVACCLRDLVPNKRHSNGW